MSRGEPLVSWIVKLKQDQKGKWGNGGHQKDDTYCQERSEFKERTFAEDLKHLQNLENDHQQLKGC